MGYLAPEHPLNLFCARVCVRVFSRTLWHHPGFLYLYLGERERLCDRIWISFTLRLQLHTVYSPKHRHKTDRCLSSQSPKETKRRARERPEEILLWWQMVSAEKLPKNNSKWIRVVVQRREKGWGEMCYSSFRQRWQPCGLDLSDWKGFPFWIWFVEEQQEASWTFFLTMKQKHCMMGKSQWNTSVCGASSNSHEYSEWLTSWWIV